MTDSQTRYRLVPTRRGPTGWYRTWHVTGLDAALASARDFHGERCVPVLVQDGSGRTVETVGSERKRRRR